MIIPVDGETDKFLITVGKKLAIATWDGTSTTVSALETLIEVENEREFQNNRFNDGKADPTGRLWAGM